MISSRYRYTGLKRPILNAFGTSVNMMLSDLEHPHTTFCMRHSAGRSAQVMCFSALPKLNTLVLNHNRIPDIDDMTRSSRESTSSSSLSAPFASLESISLRGNRIKDWSAVDHLDGLPTLRSLRFSGNPVTSGLGASEVNACFHRSGRSL